MIREENMEKAKAQKEINVELFIVELGLRLLLVEFDIREVQRLI